MSQFNNLDASTQAAMYDSVQDEQERQYLMRKALIEKFLNGWDRYNKEPLFRNIIEALMHEVEPFEIIGKLIDMNKELSDRIREFVTLHAYPSKIEVKQ
jgi:hypothetical protein